MNTIIPIITALVGAVSGFLIAAYNNRKQINMNKSKIALDIVKMEIEKAEQNGMKTSHSTLAHWAVVNALINNYDLDLTDPFLSQKINRLTEEYHENCFSGHMQEIGKLMSTNKVQDVNEDLRQANDAIQTKIGFEIVNLYKGVTAKGKEINLPL